MFTRILFIAALQTSPYNLLQQGCRQHLIAIQMESFTIAIVFYAFGNLSGKELAVVKHAFVVT